MPEANKQWVRFADYRDNPLLNPLGTPSGKIEIYSDAIAKMHYEDCPGIPTSMPPHEWYRGPEAAKYPLSLNTAHPTNRLHSQLDNTPLREKYAVADREAILIHPQDAQPRGISGGDLVRAFNDRGQIWWVRWSAKTCDRAWCASAKAPGSIRPIRRSPARCARTATSTA